MLQSLSCHTRSCVSPDLRPRPTSVMLGWRVIKAEFLEKTSANHLIAMKRAYYGRSPSPKMRKRLKSPMPLCDNHPKLCKLEYKVERRTLCQNLIADIVEGLAPQTPPRQAVFCGHRVSTPILDRGKTNILTAGQYRQHVCFLFCYLTCHS